MRNKQFYDYVHRWDVRLESLRCREEYLESLKEDNPKKFFGEYFVKPVLYGMCVWITEGITRSEITECVCWVHDIPANSNIKAGVNRKVCNEIKAIEKQAREDGYDKVVEFIEKMESDVA